MPKDIETIWNSIWKPTNLLENIRIPRWLNIERNVNIQLHGFADAAKPAYGAVIYVRTESPNGTISCRMLAAKSRVSPVNTVKIPRLELAAADVLSQLIESVRNSMELKHVPYFLWSDSTITLQWINKPAHELKIFVQNRVNRICEYTDKNCWEHVRTDQNPADLISRGLQANELINNSLWWNGPEWLSKPQKGGQNQCIGVPMSNQKICK